TSLRLVAVEQAVARDAVYNRGQLPREVVRGFDCRLHSRGARRRGAMGGVAHEEHVPITKAVRDLGADTDQLAVEDLDLELRTRPRTPNETDHVGAGAP